MKKFLAAAGVSLALSLTLVSGTAFALPSATQIETSIQQGNWSQADSQLNEVLKAHPDSARAHYLYAQVLDREGRPTEALAQLQQSKSLDPQVRFTDPGRFAQTEAKLRADAARVSGGTAGAVSTGHTSNPFAQQQAAPSSAYQQEAPQRHGPSMGMWIGIIILIAAIALILRWTLRRARTQDDTRANDDRRVQLKRVTDLLNEVRSLKLDVKLSTVPGHEALEREVEGAETQLRQMVEALSNSKNPVPPYAIEDLERQVASLKARAEGRPDPNAAPAAAPAGVGGDSAYAREANEAFGRGQPQGYPPGYPPQAPYPYPPQQQPPVVVQQGGGFGGGMGGLLTGVLLGEALNHGRDRVVERDVIVDDDEARRRAGNNDAGNFDFGQGSNDWSDGGGGGVDMGSNDNSSDWDNS